MSYLKDFQKCITTHNYPSFLKIWEEYCLGDELDFEEFSAILKNVKNASFYNLFLKDLELVYPLIETLKEKDKTQYHEIFKLIVDMQPSQNLEMGQKVFDYLQNLYGTENNFLEKIRLIGLRNKEKFQGAISKYELLSHINKGNFVFHSAGWGVGIITDFSLVREQITLEFDYVGGKKDLSFETAFKTLTPISKEHFLAQRFGNPDALEKKAKESPVEVVRMLLKDLGPKTAAEIKDELCDLVIPSKEWVKWWQNARAKIKKDTFIETPGDLRGCFKIRTTALTHESKLTDELDNISDTKTLIQKIYSFIKNFPETLKDEKTKKTLHDKLNEMLSLPEISKAQKIQIYFFQQELLGEKKMEQLDTLISELNSYNSIFTIIKEIDILAFKKKILVGARRLLQNWSSLFIDMLLTLDQSTLRDYVLSELLGNKEEESVIKKLEELRMNPTKHPETFVWYFQKIMGPKSVPFSDKQGRIHFFEAFLILLGYLDSIPEQRDLTRKMHSILSEGRYAIVRQIMQEATVQEVKEFLLLATKCRLLDDHEIKILHSLAEVAHPSLANSKKKSKQADLEQEIILWTTEEGYLKLKQRIEHIATVETVENAKEIETARGHGDLRENAEFKAALERRDRLQSEVKLLSDQISQARVLTAQDISTSQVGIGCVITCKNAQGKDVTFTLLGPWDANPDKNILSFQSKLAKTMQGKRVGEVFEMQGENLTILSIASYL